MPFLMDAWYAVAKSAEVSQKPVLRELVGEPVALYRGGSGEVSAVSDRCPHRFAPLHLGTVRGDDIQCPYHGLRFSRDGRCLHNPDGAGQIPTGAKLRVYTAAERWGYVWLWPGRSELADASQIPKLSFLEDGPTNRVVSGVMELPVNYLHGVDNAMDVAHVAVLHKNTLYSDIASARSRFWQDDDGDIWIDRIGLNTVPPPLYARFWQLAKGEIPNEVDHWAGSRWSAPSVVVNFTGIGVPGADRKQGVEVAVIHMFTPIKENLTAYHWAVARSVAINDPELDRSIAEGFLSVVQNEDIPMMMAVNRHVGGGDLIGAALTAEDRGIQMVRRELKKRIQLSEPIALQSKAQPVVA